MAALHERSRPRTWADVAGQQDAVASIRRVLAQGWGGRAWFITGLSGQGKTTLAKLIAAEGAADFATEELSARGLTPAALRDIERRYACKPLPFDGKAGWAFVVNECHGMRRDTVTEFLDVLERLPPYVCWIFTTTRTGQAKLFEDNESGDAAPLVSRCQLVDLVDSSESRRALALRAKSVAQAAGMDGLPDGVYFAALDECKGNLRALLGMVESGQLGRTALGLLERELAMVKSTKGERAEARRQELTAAIAAAKGGAA